VRQNKNAWDYFVSAAVVKENGHVRDIRVPEFHGDSYLEIPLTRRVGKTLEFQIWLLVKQPDGTLLEYGVISFALKIATVLSVLLRST